jgi:hypothetical protein
MRPLVAPLALAALAALVPSPSARAVPITGYAFGHVTEDLSADYPNARPPVNFTFGERVTLRYTYDLDPPDPVFPGRQPVTLEIHTGGGFNSTATGLLFSTARGVWPDLRLQTGGDIRSYELLFAGGEGTLTYSLDLPSYVAGFRAAVIRSDFFVPLDFPVPEPSTLVMGGIGGLLALGYAWRRRRAA